MSTTFDKVSSAILTLAALVIAGGYAKRELFPTAASAAVSEAPAAAPVYIESWKSIAEQGIALGDTTALITIVEFADLECPFCKKYQSGTLAAIRGKFGKKVSVRYLHFPIPSHRFALPAARAAECALSADGFEPFVNAVFAKQDSLGLKSWASFANDAGIRDTTSFAQCSRASSRVTRADSGTAIARRIGALGTPTIMVNGWLFKTPPSDSALAQVITSVLNDEDPFPGIPRVKR